MYEWKIIKRDSHFSIVYTDQWIKDHNGNGKNVIKFFRYDVVVKQFAFDEVELIQKTWPVEGEIWINE
jgi:hypothetical protein